MLRNCDMWLFSALVLFLVIENIRAADTELFAVLKPHFEKLQETLEFGDVNVHFWEEPVVEGMAQSKENLRRETADFSLKGGQLTGFKGVEFLYPFKSSATSVEFGFRYPHLTCTFRKFFSTVPHKVKLGSWVSEASNVSFKVTMTINNCVASATEVKVTSSIERLADCTKCKKDNWPPTKEEELTSFLNKILDQIKQKVDLEIAAVLQNIPLNGVMEGCVKSALAETAFGITRLFSLFHLV